MKEQILTVVFLILLNGLIFGQISTMKPATINENSNIIPYDSTKNYLGKDVFQYLGQELYVKGKPESLREYGYEGFVIDYMKDSYSNTSNIYKNNGKFASSYEDLVGKYFKVLEIIKHPKADNTDGYYKNLYYFKLEEKDSKTIVYFKYDSQFDASYPFIITAYFEKQKQYIGKVFVLMGKNSYNIGMPTYDCKTGLEVAINTGCIWKVSDITIEEEYYLISLLLENEKGEIVLFELKNVTDEDFILPKEMAQNYRKTFGDEKWNLILQGKVKLGMTSKMCFLSWGEPVSKNETITSGRRFEQWVYKNDSYLYFENGLLTAIQ